MTTTFKAPAVGTKGYFCVGSDTYPVTLISATKSGKTVKFRRENFVGDVENGHEYYGIQKWIITENPNGFIETARWNEKRQRYLVSGRMGVYFTGEWYAHHDPHF